MKKIFILQAVFALFLSPILAEENPVTSFSYSAIARGVDGQLLDDDTLSLQISILTSNATGPRIFREYHKVITNKDGLYSLNVGKGTKPLGLFSNIKWINDQYFLAIALDTSGTNSFQTISTTQIVVLPVVVVKTIKEEEQEVVEEKFSHYLGEPYEGGLIFHIFKDSTGTEHGLVVSYTDVSKGSEWSNVSSRFIGTNQRKMEGDLNTEAILAQDGHANSSAKICSEFSNGGFSDWYLPGIDELKLLWEARLRIVKKKSADSNYPGQDLSLYPVLYWSSTEYNADEAMGFDFNNGTPNVSYKYNSNYVRAVRRF
jgi:hypothetical protein